MGILLIWTGVFFLIGLSPLLAIANAQAEQAVIHAIGAVLFLIGLLVLWLNRINR